MKKFNYNPVAPEKNNNKAYTDDELYEFIKSAEGYLEVATDVFDTGIFSIGHGWVPQTKEDKAEWVGTGKKMSREEADKKLREVHTELWGYMESAMKKKGVDIDKVPDNILTAFKLISYGGIGNMNKNGGAIDMLVDAQKAGYTKESTKAIAGQVYREQENHPKKSGLVTRFSYYRAMIEGGYDFDKDRKDFENKTFNINKNKPLYAKYSYYNYNGLVDKMKGSEEKIDSREKPYYSLEGKPVSKDVLKNLGISGEQIDYKRKQIPENNALKRFKYILSE